MAKYDSYQSGLEGIMVAIAQTKATPDADQELLGTLESIIIERMQNPAMPPVGVATAGAQPGFSAQQMQPNNGPVPVTQAPTRLAPGLGAPGEEEIEAFRAEMPA